MIDVLSNWPGRIQIRELKMSVTGCHSALDGLFYMIGQEEKKIRTNPAAGVTDLLKSVFGK
jgi:hypothetical protein